MHPPPGYSPIVERMSKTMVRFDEEDDVNQGDPVQGLWRLRKDAQTGSSPGAR